MAEQAAEPLANARVLNKIGRPNMTRETQVVALTEKFGKLLIVRIFIYVVAGLWAFRLLSTLVWPSDVGTQYWIRVARETTRDFTVIVAFFYIQNYCANYTHRRASFALRRRDNATICSLLLVFAALDTSMPHGFLIALFVSATVYFWELHNIRRDEKALATLK
jgi:hypothetical protein